MAMASQRWFIIFVSALMLLSENGRGQGTLHWSVYRTADGLPESLCRSIVFTPRGTLIAVSFNLPFVSELDGYSVSNFVAPQDNSIGPICESPGGQRWAEAPGKLLELKNGVWLEHKVPEISEESYSAAQPIASAFQFFPVRQGCVIFLSPEKIMEFSSEDPVHPETTTICTAAQLQIGPFTGMAVSHDGTLRICGERGVAKADGLARNLNPQTSWQEYLPPETLPAGNFSAPEPDDNGSITLIAESDITHQGAVATFDGRQWVDRPAGPEKFFRAWRGPDGTFWAATPESLFKWDAAETNWVEDDEIPAGRIFDVAVEPAGAFWLATSDGLIRGSPALWEEPGGAQNINSPVQCLTADSDNRIYFVADNKLHVLESGSQRQYALPSGSQNSSDALFPLVNAPLLAEAGDVLFQFHHEDGSFKPFQPHEGQRTIPLGYLPAGSLCLYTPGTNSYFEEFDGGRLYRWSAAPAVNDPDADFNTLFVARNGDIWMGGENEVLWRHDGQWESLASKNQTGPDMAVGFAQMPDGTILCATRDSIWQFDGRKNWLLVQYGFNHINGIQESHDDSVWVASNSGLLRFYKGAWLANGAEEGLPSGPIHAVYEGQNGQVWAATSHGLSVLYPEADPDPPKTSIRRLANENSQLSEGSTLDLLLEGRAKWKLTSPDSLLYSYQLDQGDWSDFRNLTSLTFPSLAAGRHSFQVRAMDSSGNLEAVPASLDFFITLPWYEEPRLWVVLGFGAIIALFFAALALNRHRQLVLSYAAVEKKVAERTRELEVATRELVHSQKMNALGTLAAGIAHDFNNILSIIKGSAQIIEDNTDQPDKIHVRVARIKTVVQQGAEIVDAMLGFSRGSDASAVPCDVNIVVSDTLKLLGDRFLRQAEVKFERGEELLEIFAPREFIQQILLNFIFNAAEAMGERKEITLATGATNKLHPDIFLAPAPANSFILISVRDRGSGIAPEIMPRIFEPFFTTKAFSSRRGTGLGLSMVYELAKKMNAGLAVQSIVGQGSTFTLILPVSQAGAQKTAPQVPVSSQTL
jgi:signal transduction histidine kinase